RSHRDRRRPDPLRRHALGIALGTQFTGNGAWARTEHLMGIQRGSWAAALLFVGLPACKRTVQPARDPFGIAELYPSHGPAWFSKWAGPPRAFGSAVDPGDAEFDADHGEASYEVRDGVLSVSGEVPRMYVHDASRTVGWRNVEVTTYAMRVADSGIPWGGIMA